MSETQNALPEHNKVTDLLSRLDDRIGELRRHL